MKKKRRPKGPDPDAFSKPALYAMPVLCSPTTLLHCMIMPFVCQNACFLMPGRLTIAAPKTCTGCEKSFILTEPERCRLAAVLPAREVLEIAQANPPGPRPVPNLG